MIKAIVFLLFFLSIHNISFSQEEISHKSTKKVHSEFSTRIGLNTLNEVNLHYELLREGKVNILASVGINYGSGTYGSSGGLLCSQTIFIGKYTKRKGMILRAGINYSKDESKWGKRIFAVYVYGKAPNIVHDEGCHSGSNSSDYERYDLKTSQIGIMHYFDKNVKNKYINMYMGIGLFVKNNTKSNRFEGQIYYHQRTPDVKETQFGLAIDLGMKINLFRLKAKPKS